jgi:hypothetical protein
MTTIRAPFVLLPPLFLLVACPFGGKQGAEDTTATSTGAAGTTCMPCTAGLEACSTNLCTTDADCLAVAPSGDNYCATPDAFPSHPCCDADGCVASRCWGKGSQTDPCASQRECLSGFCCAPSPTFADCHGAPCCLPASAADCGSTGDAGGIDLKDGGPKG